jgi:predicted metal-dependent peptidase
MTPTEHIKAEIRSLIRCDPWYGLMLRHFEVVETLSVPTIGVRHDGHGDNFRFQLVFNPEFIDKLDRKELQEILKHEVLHPTFHHCRKETSSMRWNIAQDCAINSLLDLGVFQGLVQKFGCYLPGEGILVDIPAGKSADWYHANLPDSVDEGSGEGSGTIDDHSQMSPEVMEKLKDIIKKTTEYIAESNQWGSVSEKTREHLRNYLSGYDWRAELEHCVGRIRDMDVISTRRKYNKRHAHAPGIIRKRVPRVLVAIDESGSVSAELWVMLANALASLSLHAEFDLVPFDFAVAADRLTRFKRGKPATFGRSLAGGTNFDAPTSYFNEQSRDYDMLLIATDGEAPAPGHCDKRRVWLLPHGRQLMFNTGERVIFAR